LGIYDAKKRLNFGGEWISFVKGIFLSMVFYLSFMFLAKEVHISRGFLLLFFFTNILYLTISRAFLRKWFLHKNKKSKRPHEIWFVGKQGLLLPFAERLAKNPHYGYQPTRLYVDKKSGSGKSFLEIKSFSKLFTDLSDKKPDILICAHTVQNGKGLRKILNAADEYGIQVYIVPDMSAFLAHNTFIEVVEGMPLISVQNIPLRRGYNWFLKRGFDVVFSALALLLVSPLFPFVALAIYLTDGRPIFFSQIRVGLDNKPFKIYKFRTMVVQDKETSDKLWTVDNDPRITKIGRFLRKTNIDELPQFWNVLKGDMSVVGPRAERPYFVEKFKKDIGGYMKRHQVKSGITGLAQVLGLRGDTSIEKRIQADIYYIENWSLFLDIQIIFLTAVQLVIPYRPKMSKIPLESEQAKIKKVIKKKRIPKKKTTKKRVV
ncbi:MAG: sugar transferase, partial [Candidatus Hydrogenedentota bacterium]